VASPVREINHQTNHHPHDQALQHPAGSSLGDSHYLGANCSRESDCLELASLLWRTP
jgi:hypothetical protein